MVKLMDYESFCCHYQRAITEHCRGLIKWDKNETLVSVLLKNTCWVR